MNSGENNQINLDNTVGSGTISLEDAAVTVFEQNGTFCRVGSAAHGILEVDLQSIKQKGIELRNISFAIPLGLDENQQPLKAEMLFMNENDFLKFKEFIAKLNWND